MKVEKTVLQVPVTTTEEVVSYKFELTEREAVVLLALVGNTNSNLLSDLYYDMCQSGIPRAHLKNPITDLQSQKSEFDRFSNK